MLVEAMVDEGGENRRMPGQMPGFADFMDEAVDEPADAVGGRELDQNDLAPPWRQWREWRDEDSEAEDGDEDEDEDEDISVSREFFGCDTVQNRLTISCH